MISSRARVTSSEAHVSSHVTGSGAHVSHVTSSGAGSELI